MSFNGGQALLTETGSALFRIDRATGQIAWRTSLAQTPSAVIAAPGGRIAVLTSVPSVQLFDGESGALLSTLPIPPGVSQPVLAAGQTDLFVLGSYSCVANFDPGTSTDGPAGNRGVFISRYSFEQSAG